MITLDNLKRVLEQLKTAEGNLVTVYYESPPEDQKPTLIVSGKIYSDLDSRLILKEYVKNGQPALPNYWWALHEAEYLGDIVKIHNLDTQLVWTQDEKKNEVNDDGREPLCDCSPRPHVKNGIFCRRTN